MYFRLLIKTRQIFGQTSHTGRTSRNNISKASLTRDWRVLRQKKKNKKYAGFIAMSAPPWTSRVSYPPLLSRARRSRSDIRVKTPVMAGVYTEYTSLLQDMGAAIAAAEGLWKNFIDTSTRYTDTLVPLLSVWEAKSLDWSTYWLVVTFFFYVQQ